jgi:hypothetical protein
MHPDVTSSFKGACPKRGMDLELKKNNLSPALLVITICDYHFKVSHFAMR